VGGPAVGLVLDVGPVGWREAQQAAEEIDGSAPPVSGTSGYSGSARAHGPPPRASGCPGVEATPGDDARRSPGGACLRPPHRTPPRRTGRCPSAPQEPDADPRLANWS
jgi:hypothetical protein